MKKADNFDTSKWLTENKITTQSRLNEDEAYLSPSMQKQFNMIVSALKKAKSEEDIDRVHSDIILLPKKLTKIFIDKLVNMGLADREGEGKYSLSYDDGLDESRLNEDDMQNISSTYPQYDRFEFRKFKDNLEMKVHENYPLTGDIKSQLPKNLMQVSPDNIETDWAKIDYTIIKGNNNMSVRLDYPMYINLYYDTKDIKDLYKKTADEAGFKYKDSPNQGVITLLFSK